MSAASSSVRAQPGATTPADGAASGPGMLIVGASQSGVQLAGSLRALGYEGRLTLLGDEDHRPYQRPPLSKAFLHGDMTRDQMVLRNADYWSEHRINLVRNERIERVERSAGGSGTAFAASGASWDFDRLVLAVGARARRLDVPGEDLPGTLYLRNADDALALRAQVPQAQQIVIVGGGFVGLETALSLRKLGKEVTVLAHGERLIGRAVGRETSAYFLRAHRERGVQIRLNTGVRRIRGTEDGDGADRVSGVETTGGEVIPAQIVLLGIGAVPNTELAESMGLLCEDGVVVDDQAVASDGTTLAVGDCANLPNPLPGAEPGDRVRLESVNNAIEHAKVAAYSLTGRQGEYAGIPWFWSDQGDLKLQIAGLSRGYDRTLLRHDGTGDRFSMLYYAGDQVVAADCVNVPLDFMAVRSALAQGATIPYEQATDTSVRLKTLITTQT